MNCRLWFPLGGMVLWAVILSCTTAPVPPPAPEPPAPALPSPAPDPRGELRFDRAEAASGARIRLFFLAAVENPRSAGARLDLADWRLAVDGRRAPAEAGLVPEGQRVEAGTAAAIPLGLTVDLAALFPKGAESAPAEVAADAVAELTAELAFSFDNGERAVLTLSAGTVFPRIREPEFSITCIEIMKAELINTRLKVDLRIDNPNGFPLTLSSLSYELYGQGRLWAEGTETDILLLPPEASAEKELRLVMNFIDMDRRLLDRVIAQGLVPYRFTGEAEAATGLDFLPRFRTAFDQSGVAEVVD
ncbi:MAG: LEA type 2 family protein [Spirochaetaceae bacterium]|jgi:LEA14-like dessication related protein|nr:LEA type 2 family protein [Spirochaetaceae bacterium]